MNKFSQFTEEEKSRAYKVLKNYIDEKVLNDSTGGINWGVLNSQILNQIKDCESLKRTILSDVIIKDCIFRNCAMTGSKFTKVNFINTILDGNNLLSSIFLECHFNFDNATFNLINNSFSQCQFFNCKFKNVIFSASTISQTLFSNCTFENCKFSSVTLENTKFINCFLKDVDMTALNIEFAKFVDNKLDNVGFPFYQFYYIIGSKEILNENELVYFKAGNTIVDLNEYIKLKDELIVFYSERNAYFPITNIFISQSNVNTAKKSLYDGVSLSLELKDFRMIKHFCRLGKEYSIIDGNLAQSILSNIDNCLISENNNKISKSNVLEQMLIHSGEIRQLLMNDGIGGKQTLQFSVITNISQKDTRRINKLQNKLQKILDKYGCGADVKFIETRHNSPYELFIQVVGQAEMLLSISFMIISTVKNFGRFCLFLKNRKKNTLDKVRSLVSAKFNKEVEDVTESNIQDLRNKVNSVIKELKDKAKIIKKVH